MDVKKFQIFVSSTYSDLAQMRRSVSEAIQRLNHFPVGMEQFSADDDEQWQVIRETLEQTDYYVCIIGHRYGSLSSDGRSFTEKEWDYARELGIPIMSFIRDRDAATTPQERDNDPKQVERLDKFVEKVKAEKMVDFWTDGTDLNQKVLTALFKAFSRKPRPGWIRAQSDQVAEELATLIQENRTLRNEVDRLTSEVRHTRPRFEVRLNGGTKVEMKFVPDADLSLTEQPYLPPVTWSEVPDDLKPYLTEDEVDEYNESIPEASEIERRVTERRRLERIKFAAVDLDIAIANLGSAKGRQVYVDLILPPEVTVWEKDELRRLELPKLDLPRNPIAKAKKKKTQAETQRSPYGYQMRDPLANLISDMSFPVPHITPRKRWLRVEGNKITVWIEDLLHTREVAFHEAVLVPFAEGSFEIAASVICEEFESPESISFPVVVTRGTIADLPLLQSS